MNWQTEEPAKTPAPAASATVIEPPAAAAEQQQPWDVDWSPESPMPADQFDPVDFAVWKQERDANSKRSLPVKASAFLGGVVRGGADLLKTIWGGVSEIPSSWMHPVKAYRTYKEAATRGTVDLIQLLDNLRGAAGDKIVDQGEEDRREYDRYRTSLAFAKVRDQGMVYAPDQVYPKMAEAASNVLDPTIVIPFIGEAAVPAKLALRTGLKQLALKSAKVAELAAGAARNVERVASVPRRILEKGMEVTGKFTPQEISMAGKLAKGGGALSPFVWQSIPGVSKAAQVELGAQVIKGANDVAATMLQKAGDPTRKMRFLQKVATDPEILKKSPNLARLAAFAHTHGGTDVIDGTFNVLADGLQIGIPQMALMMAAGGGPEDVGRSLGGSLVMGGLTAPITGKRGAGATPDMRDQGSVDHYVRTIGEDVQTSGFKTLPKRDQVLLAAMNEVGLPVKATILEPGVYKELAKARGAEGTEGFFDKAHGELFVNSAAPSGKSSVLLHEAGHAVMTDIVRNDPLASRAVLSSYTDPKGMEFKFRDGSTIKLNKEAQDFLADYNARNPQVEIKRAEDLAGEIGAEQFGYLMGSGKDLFELGKNRRVQGAAVEAGFNLLSKLGLVDRKSGAPLNDYNPISKRLSGNPDVQKLLSNYIAARRDHMKWQDAVMENATELRPKQGQSVDDMIRELDARATVMPREELKRADPKLVQKALKDYLERNPPKAGEANIGKGNEGAKLSPGLVTYLEWQKRAPKLMQMVNSVESAIQRGGKLAFYYSKRVDNKGNNPLGYYEATPYAFELTKNGNINAKSWDEGALQAAVARLVDKKLVADPERFMKDIKAASDRQRLGQPINDQRIAAMLGAEPGRITDPAWASVAEEMRRKGVIRSFRLDGIQGFADLGTDGLAFKWDNVRTANRPAFPDRPAQGSKVPSSPK